MQYPSDREDADWKDELASHRPEDYYSAGRRALTALLYEVPPSKRLEVKAVRTRSHELSQKYNTKVTYLLGADEISAVAAKAEKTNQILITYFNNYDDRQGSIAITHQSMDEENYTSELTILSVQDPWVEFFDDLKRKTDGEFDEIEMMASLRDASSILPRHLRFLAQKESFRIGLGLYSEWRSKRHNTDEGQMIAKLVDPEIVHGYANSVLIEGLSRQDDGSLEAKLKFHCTILDVKGRHESQHFRTVQSIPASGLPDHPPRNARMTAHVDSPEEQSVEDRRRAIEAAFEAAHSLPIDGAEGPRNKAVDYLRTLECRRAADYEPQVDFSSSPDVTKPIAITTALLAKNGYLFSSTFYHPGCMIDLRKQDETSGPQSWISDLWSRKMSHPTNDAISDHQWIGLIGETAGDVCREFVLHDFDSDGIGEETAAELLEQSLHASTRQILEMRLKAGLRSRIVGRSPVGFDVSFPEKGKDITAEFLPYIDTGGSQRSIRIPSLTCKDPRSESERTIPWKGFSASVERR